MTILPEARGSMASARKSIKTRTHQKSHALRMLLTSGVIRGADVDPPGMSDSRFQTSPTRTIYPNKSVHTKLVHTTGHKRHVGLLAQWHTTFIDILKEFGKR
ncbi:MAG: hypothetical protein DYH03_05570 [Nitrospira sp. NTP1]|nr:hypothetical protein [Nitrospira sp. NTP1]